MRNPDKLTNQDVAFQLLIDDHATEATTAIYKILSNDHTQANLSEHLKESKSTSNNNNNIISHLERQALHDIHDSTDVPKWNDVHGGTHRDFSNIPSAEKQALKR